MKALSPEGTTTHMVAVEGGALPLFCTGQVDDAMRPLVVLMFPRSGMDGFPQRVAAWLGHNGCGVVIPDITWRQADKPVRERKKYLKDPEIVADIQATLGMIAEWRGAHSKRLFIMGHCMGGRNAFLGATVSDRFDGSIVFYGGDIFVGWGGAVAPIERLSGLACPLLGFSGGKDTNPSPADMERLDNELTARRIPHRVHIYPEVGHAFQQHADRSPEERAAADDSCARTLIFIADPAGAIAGAT
jgi:carboxymethylenebutenolidase